MEIKCDKCGARVNEVRPEQIRNGDIEHTYFRCPECGAVYPVAATDAALRKDIAGYSRMRQMIRMKPVTEKFIRNAEALKQRNLKRTRELMERFPLAPLLSE